jgi:uncharacterized protein YheU (UPF0270 family)
MSGSPPIEIPCERLSAELLTRLIEEFVCREGTDYGHTEYSLSDKVAAVRRQLETGQAKIVFDQETETTTIILNR